MKLNIMIMRRLLFVVVFSLTVVLSFAFHEPRTKPKSSEPDFYKFVLQWGNAFCSNLRGTRWCRQPVPQEFIIHGFWGCFESDDTIIPDCQEGVHLIEDHLQNLDQSLKTNWPNLVSGERSFQVWTHQWQKHGRCLGLQPRAYFDKVLSLKRQIERRLGTSLVHFFTDQGLPPRNDITYDSQRFPAEIYSKIGLVTQLNCNSNKAGQVQLLEVRFCFSLKWNLIDCPYISWDRDHQAAPVFKVSNCYKDYAQAILFPAPPPTPPPRRISRRRPTPPPLPSPPSTEKKSPPKKVSPTAPTPPRPPTKEKSPPEKGSPSADSFQTPLLPFQLTYLQVLKASICPCPATNSTSKLPSIRRFVPKKGTPTTPTPPRPPTMEKSPSEKGSPSVASFPPPLRPFQLTYLQALKASLRPCTATNSTSELPSIRRFELKYLKIESRNSNLFHWITSSILSGAVFRIWMRLRNRKKEKLTESRQKTRAVVDLVQQGSYY